MPRPYKFIEDKIRREEYIRKVIEVINSTAKELKIEKTYDVEEVIKSSNDEKKIEEYNKAKEALEKDEARRKFADALLKGKQLGGKFGRIYYNKILLPEENGLTKEEIDERNNEIVEKFTDPSRIPEIVREEINTVFKADKTLFYPENLDEAISNYEKYHDILNSSYAIDSTIKNNLYVLSSEFDAMYDYYKTIIEDGNNVRTYIDEKASIYSLFIPEDMDTTVFSVASKKLNELAEEYKDFGLGYTFGNDGTNSYLGYLYNKNNEKGLRKDLKDFFKNHDKDFVIKNKIGGPNFKDQFVKIGKDNIEKNIQEGFKGAKALKNGNLITTRVSKDLRMDYIAAFDVYSNYKDGPLSASGVDELYYNKQTGEYKQDKLNEVYFLYSIIKDKKDERSVELKPYLENYLSEFEAPKSRAEFYKQIVQGNVSIDSVFSISDDGFKIFEDATVCNKTKAELQNLKASSISSLRNKFDKGDIKNNVKENPIKFMTFAKAINEKYYSRGTLSKIFSPFAWREKWLINDINDYVKDNKLNETKLNDFINCDKNTFDTKFEDCLNTLKEVPIQSIDNVQRKRINIEYKENTTNINNNIINENERKRIKEEFVEINKEEINKDVINTPENKI